MNEVFIPIRQEESKYQPAKMTNLFKMDEKEQEKLKEQINTSHGVVQVWVHTHYKDKHLNHEEGEDCARNGYFKELEKLIKNSSNSSVPVIAFIESDIDADSNEDDIRKYGQLYREYHSKNNTPIYYVRTFPNDSAPNISSGENFDADTKRQNFDRLANLMKSVGIKTAIVSGMMFETSMPSYTFKNQSFITEQTKAYINNHPKSVQEGKVLLPYGCVGEVLEQFEYRNIHTLLSSVTSPGKKLYY